MQASRLCTRGEKERRISADWMQESPVSDVKSSELVAHERRREEKLPEHHGQRLDRLDGAL